METQTAQRVATGVKGAGGMGVGPPLYSQYQTLSPQQWWRWSKHTGSDESQRVRGRGRGPSPEQRPR